jgi:hypothetical protein
MRWSKLGIVYAPNGEKEWAKTHAMVPTPFLLNDETIRVFVTFCDANMTGRTGFVDVDARDPRRVIQVSESPVLDVGAPGNFDSNGVVACSVTRDPFGRLFLYYGGFELCHDIRYRLLAGVAISEDNGATFTRAKETPALERSDEERFFRSGPSVMFDDGVFKMWYCAGSQWEEIDGKQMPVYELRYLESTNGVHWGARGRTALALTDADEHGFGRPWVTRDANGLSMFYSIRRRSLRAYRMGFSRSKGDPLTWNRQDDQLGLDVSPGSFDSDAIMYAAPITAHGKTWCFYNGNDFGREGFAVAELVGD